MATDRSFQRLVRERVTQTGETCAQSAAQLRPRAASIRHYAYPGETTVDALRRAYQADLPVVAYCRDVGPERVTWSAALRLIRDERVDRFSVMLDGREVSL